MADPDVARRVDSACATLESRGLVEYVRSCGSWRDLTGALAEDPTGVCVIDPYCGASFMLEEIRQLMSRFPVSGVIIYARFDGRRAGADVLRLRDIGVEHVVSMGYDDSRQQLVAQVMSATGFIEMMDALSRVEDVLTEEQRMVMSWAIRSGTGRTSVTALAETFGVSARTLRRWCETLEGMSVGDVVRWARVLHACRLLGRTAMPVSRVAFVMGFSCARDLDRQLRRTIGVAAAAVDRRAVVRLAIERFELAMREAGRKQGRRVS